jgi:hypothetical protein
MTFGFDSALQEDRKVKTIAEPIGRRLYHTLHSQLGVPWAPSIRLIRAAKTLRRPFEHRYRRKIARRLLDDSAFASKVSRKEGYWQFSACELPGAREVATYCSALLDEQPESSSRNKKQHLQALLSGRDFRKHQVVLDFALSRPVIEAAAGYFETAPVLYSIVLFWTPPNDTILSSQRYHLDGEDLSQLKLFVNVKEVGPANGPLSFLSAPVTKEVLDSLSRHRRLNAATETFDDDLVSQGTKGQGPIAAIGPAGSGVFVDTSRCLHYGSRKNTEGRCVLMIKYGLSNMARESNSEMADTSWINLERTDELQKLALTRPAK